jgi:RimJ/RimL family protein N-acetyltransferase
LLKGERERVPSALELMRMHVDALYTHDARLRMQSINQWSGGTAPRFFLGRTEFGAIRRFRVDVPDDLAAAAESLREEDVLSRRPAHEADYIRLFASTPVERVWTGPAFHLASSTAPAVRCTAIDATNADLLRGGFEAWLPDVPYCRPFMAVIEAGHAIAICASVRITPAAHEAGVETLPAYRGKGNAARVVAAWANAIRTLGAIPLYSTSWDNAASQRVAGKLGASMFGVDFHIT